MYACKLLWSWYLVSRSLASTRFNLLQEATHGPREKLLYIPAVQTRKDKPDYLVTVDVDPESSTFSQARLLFNREVSNAHYHKL